MAQVITDKIQSKKREAHAVGSKGFARKARAEGFLPATAYGPGTEQQFLLLSPKAFAQQVTKFGIGHIYDVEVEGGKGFKCMVKEVQRDFVRDQLIHVDLYAVDLKKEVRIEVALELVGKAKGIVEGGIITQTQRHIEVLTLPDKVPEKLTLDITELGLGESLHLSDIPLPEGVKFTAHANETVVTCTAPEGAAAPSAEAAES